MPGANASRLHHHLPLRRDRQPGPDLAGPIRAGGWCTRTSRPTLWTGLLRTVDALNRQSTFDRDNAGNVTAATDTLGRTSRWAMTRTGGRPGSPTRAGSPPGSPTTRRATRSAPPPQPVAKTTWTYDDDGFLISATEPRGQRRRARTRNGTPPTTSTTRPATSSGSIDPLDHTTSYAYDANNRQIAVDRREGRGPPATRYREDDQIRTAHGPGRCRTTPTAAGPGRHRLRLRATTVGSPRSRDPKGHRTELGYDEAGRLTAGSTRWDAALRSATTPRTTRVSMITVGRHEGELSDEERAKRTIVTTYDIVGRREYAGRWARAGPVYTLGLRRQGPDHLLRRPHRCARGGLRRRGPDHARSLRREAGGVVERFGYDYDARGNIASRSYPDGTRVSAGYDADSRITSLTSVGGAAGAPRRRGGSATTSPAAARARRCRSATGLVERRRTTMPAG